MCVMAAMISLTRRAHCRALLNSRSIRFNNRSVAISRGSEQSLLLEWRGSVSSRSSCGTAPPSERNVIDPQLHKKTDSFHGH
jgi:hypothetical protein